MSVFVAFEGPDGAGKTTTIELIQQTHPVSVFKTPSDEYAAHLKEYNRAGVLVPERFGFYAAGLLLSAREIAAHTAISTLPAIVDKYKLCTEIFHHEMDPGTDYGAILRGMRIPDPDVYFILTADDAVLDRRIAERPPRYDSDIERNRDFMRRINARYKAIALPNAVHIDTGRFSPEEVARICLERLV